LPTRARIIAERQTPKKEEIRKCERTHTNSTHHGDANTPLTIPQALQKGRDLEKAVLSRAVRWHLDHRILVYDRKTVVFD
jgi:hypothetical protein